MTSAELKALRAKLKLTQTELAQRIGVARNTITRWEIGLRHIPEPIARLLQHIAKEVKEEQKRKKSRRP